MSRILISTIGKKTQKNDASHSEYHRYDDVCYSFDDGSTYNGAFFMLALQDYLNKNNVKMDKIVLLGTSSSMWDALLEHTDFSDDELLEQLPAAVSAGNVTADLLERLSTQVKGHLQIPLVCRLIPMGKTPVEQAEILQIIASQVSEDDKVYMDVTHGFRSLPMFELLAVSYMKEALNVDVEAIYYGAAEMRDKNDGLAPVIKLDFILDMFRWLHALPQVREIGRYDAIAGLMAGFPDIQKSLRQLSFEQRLNQIELAAPVARNLNEGLQNLPENITPAIALFRKPLMKNLNWVTKDGLARQQILNARIALKYGDYLRCAILLQEARISMHMSSRDMNNYIKREEKKIELDKSTDWEDEILNALRNALAHASASDKHSRAEEYVRKLLQDESALIKELEHLADYYYKELQHIESKQQ